VTTYNFDINKNLLTSIEDAKSNLYRYKYFTDNRLDTIYLDVNENGIKDTTETGIGYTYDTENRIYQIVSPKTTYKFLYDDFGNIENVSVDGLATNLAEYVYNANNGKLTQTTYGNDDYIINTYDDLDRIIALRYNRLLSENPQYTFTYNGNGQLHSYTDTENLTTIFYKYDNYGRIIGTSQVDTGTNSELFSSSIRYNNVNLPDYLTYNYGSFIKPYTFNYNYYSNIIANISLPSGGILYYDYDDFERIEEKRIESSGSTLAGEEYTYKTISSNTSHVVNNVKLLVTNKNYTYDYDELGNIISVKENNVLKLSYEYNALGQLSRENNVYTNTTTCWYYDKAGNISSECYWTYRTGDLGEPPYGLKGYTYDTSSPWGDRLLTYNSGSTITYDEIGNPLSYNSRYLSWKGRQLSSLSLGMANFSYKYNSDGLRTVKTNNSNQTTKYYYDGDKLIYEIYDEPLPGDYKLFYMYDAEGDVIGFQYIWPAGTTDTYYYGKNLQGDVIELYKDGALYATYSYDAWGKVVSVKDAAGNTITSSTHIAMINPIRYRSYYLDRETNFYYLQSRFYDPDTGRYINAKDLSQIVPSSINGVNLFTYSVNNPVTINANTEMITQVYGMGTVTGNVGANEGNPSINEWLKLLVGAIPDIIKGSQYLTATGIHNKFVYSTKTLYMFPKIDSTWSRFKITKLSYGELVGASFKQIVASDVRAGLGAMFKSFGNVVGINVATNLFGNLCVNGFDITDVQMWQDTAIDTAIGVGSFYLASGTMSLITVGIASAGFAIPGIVVVGGVVLLSIGYDWLIREITGYDK